LNKSGLSSLRSSIERRHLTNVPANQIGLPIQVSDGSGITSINLTLRYDESFLDITFAAPGADAPDGASVDVDQPGQGEMLLQFNSPLALGAGPAEFVTLTAIVPDTAIGTVHIVEVSDIEANDGAIFAIPDDAVHTLAYFGDTTGNGDYSGLDAVQIARVVVGLDSGLEAYPLVDPVIIADITGNGDLSGLDAVLVAQEVVGLDPPEIPALPAGTEGAMLLPAGSLQPPPRSAKRGVPASPSRTDIVIAEFPESDWTVPETYNSRSRDASDRTAPQPLPFLRPVAAWHIELRDIRAIDETLGSQEDWDWLEGDNPFESELVDDSQ
jgi:hypothetical protein